MIEIAGARHQDFITLTGDGKRGGYKSLIASRSDMNLSRRDLGTIDVAKMSGIGAAKVPVPLDPSIFRAVRIGRRGLEGGDHCRMRGITGYSLAHIYQRALVSSI